MCCHGSFSVILCVLVIVFCRFVCPCGSFSVVSCVLVGRFLLFCVPLRVVFCCFVCPCGSFSVISCVLVGRFLLFCVSLWVVFCCSVCPCGSFWIVPRFSNYTQHNLSISLPRSLSTSAMSIFSLQYQHKISTIVGCKNQAIAIFAV